MTNIQMKLNLEYKENITEDKVVEKKKTSIVDKVVYLIFNSEEKIVHLNDLYKALKNHSQASVRGNINRYLKMAKESSLIKRVSAVDGNGKKLKGYYTLNEIISIRKDEETDELLINYTVSYKAEGKEVTAFYKDYKIEYNEEVQAGVYRNDSTFDSIIDVENAANELAGIAINDDVMNVLSKIKDNTFDLVVTDPPYRCIPGGKPKKKGQPSGILAKNDGKIFRHNNIDFDTWLPEVYRVLKKGCHAYIFINHYNLEKMLTSARKAGFLLHNVLVWQKNIPVVNRWYMKNAEYVLFLRKGRAKVIENRGSMVVHQFDTVRDKKKLIPDVTEKPVDLLSMYIENSSNEGDLVFDPFGGSLATARAALKTMRKFFTVEIDKNFYGVAVNSVKALL